MSGRFSAAVLELARARLRETGAFDSLGESPVYEYLRSQGEVTRQLVRYWDGGRTATYCYLPVIVVEPSE